MIKARTIIALATAAMFAAGSAATAQVASPKPPVKKVMKHHARKNVTRQAGEQYLRAAGSAPAPKASK